MEIRNTRTNSVDGPHEKYDMGIGGPYAFRFNGKDWEFVFTLLEPPPKHNKSRFTAEGRVGIFFIILAFAILAFGTYQHYKSGTPVLDDAVHVRIIK